MYAIHTSRVTHHLRRLVVATALLAAGAAVMVTERVAQANTSELPSAPDTAGLVSLGNSHACYIIDGGQVKCWGLNASGQAGNGTITNVDLGTETAVAGIADAVAVTTSVHQSCALLAEGTIRCWGSQDFGALGNGVSSGNATTPVTVSGITDAVQVELRNGGACALTQRATVMCWGKNSEGAVGDGTTTHRTTPVTVSGLVNPIRLASGDNALVSCVITDGATTAATDNELWCWGNGQNYQLTDGTSNSATSPRRMTLDGTAPLTGVLTATVGDWSTCALLADGTVWCWGSENGGRLGNGVATATYRHYPTQVQMAAGVPLTQAISLSASQGLNCVATVSAGTRGQRCWGVASVDTPFATFVPQVTTSAVAHIMASQLITLRAVRAEPAASGFVWCAVMDDASLVCKGDGAARVVTTNLAVPPPNPSVDPGQALPVVLPPLITEPEATPPSSTTTTTTTPPTPTTPRPTTPPPTTTVAPVPNADGNLPDLDTGQSLVTENGEPVTVELLIENNQALVLRSPDFELRLTGQCTSGCTLTESADGGAFINLERSGTARVSGFGFLPGSQVHVWIFSEPHYLGALPVAADGTFTGDFPLSDIAVGTHTMQANGLSADSLPRSANLGIVVSDVVAPAPDTDNLPATGIAADTWVIWATAMGVLGLLLITGGRRRRHAP